MVWRGPVAPQTMDFSKIYEIMWNLVKSTAEPGNSVKFQVFPVLCDLRRPGPLQTIYIPKGILMFPAWGRQCSQEAQKC